ncbi:GCN5-related N-acetyltransferase [Streptomyces laurentii]|uniref:GCN5-related N-acetyltransferase n=1 Tax=Streptomyces laurentii TaxID=39478 RepID=A0A169NH15_STRLU|nr:GCN5-related N-acetyltransferase [Streptomyces laurentii]
MSLDSAPPLLTRARDVWRQLAAEPVEFGAAGEVAVVASPGSAFCPPGWAGVVVLGGAALVTAPDEETAARIRTAVAALSAERLTDPAAVRAVLPVSEFLGPAALAYVAADGFRPAVSAGPRVTELDAAHPDVAALAEAAGTEDAGEAALDEIGSPAFVVRSGERVVAAAGYRRWPGAAAHLSVLTAPGSRGLGLARTTASAAVRHALAHDLLPQWRARVPASRAVAAALGFRELGHQLAFRGDRLPTAG